MIPETLRPYTGSSHPRKMPSHYDIVWHWAPILIEQGRIFDIEELVQVEFEINQKGLRAVCFACGNPYSKHHRAHIMPRRYGSSDEADNLHVLCTSCHEASEDLLDEVYWRWFGTVGFRSWFEWTGDLAARRTGCVDFDHFGRFCQDVLKHYDGNFEQATAAVMEFCGYTPKQAG